MNSFAYYLGRHAHELTFSQVLWLLCMACLIKAVFDGTLWSLVLAVWSVLCYGVTMVVGRYQRWSMLRLLTRQRDKMVKQRLLLQKNIAKIEAMVEDPVLPGREGFRRTVGKMKVLDQMLGVKTKDFDNALALLGRIDDV